MKTTKNNPPPGSQQAAPQTPQTPQTSELHSQWSQLLASNVRHLRTQRNLSQEDLADACGIFRTYLGRIESGRCNPSLSVMLALAGALRIPPHRLFLPLDKPGA